MRPASVLGIAYVAVLIVSSVGCVERHLKGDGRIVDSATVTGTLIGKRVEVTLTSTADLSAAVTASTLLSLDAGLDRPAVEARIGRPADSQVVDYRGTVWSQWRTDRGLLEVGHEPVGSSPQSVGYRWMIRLQPTTHDLRHCLTAEVLAVVPDDSSLREIVIESPKDDRRLWATLEDERVIYIYLVKTADRVLAENSGP